METVKNETKYQSIDNEILIQNYKEALNKAAELVRKNNWRCSLGDWEELEDITYEISDLTRKQKKKLRNKINKVLRKPNLGSINRLLWFVSKVVLGLDKAYNVRISEKEEAIQKARQEWKKARDIADELLMKYKTEKGNFYKLK